MAEDDLAAKAIERGFKRLDDARCAKLPQIRLNGEGAIDGLALDPEAGTSLKRIRGLLKQRDAVKRVAETLFGAAGFLPLGKAVAIKLIKETSRFWDRRSNLTADRTDGVRPEVMRKITLNANSMDHIRQITHEPLRGMELQVAEAVIEFLNGEFTYNEALWVDLAKHDDAFVASSARNLHARELSRLGFAQEALDRLGEPNIAAPDADAFFNVSMRLNLEVQGYDLGGASGTDRIRRHLDVADAVMRASSKDAPASISQIDRSWISERADRFQQQFGLGGIYTVFNHLILRSLVNSETAEASLHDASLIARHVGGRHRSPRFPSKAPDAKTAIRMMSLVAIAADHLHEAGRLPAGAEIRDEHLRAMLLEDRQLFSYLDDLRAAVLPGQFVSEPAFQCASLLLAELRVHGQFPMSLEHRWTEVLGNVRAMRNRRDEGHPLITAFARSCDFALEKIDKTPRSRTPEYLDARNFRLFASRRITD